MQAPQLDPYSLELTRSLNITLLVQYFNFYHSDLAVLNPTQISPKVSHNLRQHLKQGY